VKKNLADAAFAVGGIEINNVGSAAITDSKVKKNMGTSIRMSFEQARDRINTQGQEWPSIWRKSRDCCYIIIRLTDNGAE
jgi:hypothetical protein